MADGIEYPDYGKNGENILGENLITINPKPIIYSIRVNISKGKVRIIMPIPDDPENTWSYFKYTGMSVGWKLADIINESIKEVHLLSDTSGSADLPVYFIGHNSIDIKIFENDDNTPTRIKKISW